MKKTYYKIWIAEDEWWVCTLGDLIASLAEWTKEYGEIKISWISLTDKEFEDMPEYQG
jgi:hypothetical protein